MKLICGDCIEAMRQIPDGSIDMVLADPPYGTTANKWDRTLPLEKLWRELRRVIRPNGAICLFAQQPFATDLINGSRRVGESFSPRISERQPDAFTGA